MPHQLYRKRLNRLILHSLVLSLSAYRVQSVCMHGILVCYHEHDRISRNLIQPLSYQWFGNHQIHRKLQNYGWYRMLLDQHNGCR